MFYDTKVLSGHKKLNSLEHTLLIFEQAAYRKCNSATQKCKSCENYYFIRNELKVTISQTYCLRYNIKIPTIVLYVSKSFFLKLVKCRKLLTIFVNNYKVAFVGNIAYLNLRLFA